MTNDFNNFVRIAFVVFTVMTPVYLFSAYYDEYVLDIFNQRGMVAYIRGSGLTKLLNWFVLFPLTSAFLANWHRYILFSGKNRGSTFLLIFQNILSNGFGHLLKLALSFLFQQWYLLS